MLLRNDSLVKINAIITTKRCLGVAMYSLFSSSFLLTSCPVYLAVARQELTRPNDCEAAMLDTVSDAMVS